MVHILLAALNPSPANVRLTRRPGWARLLAVPCIAALGAACYSLLQPGVFPHDVGDNQVAAVSLGIQHCPGYPLLTLLGHPFTRLFPRDPAYGVTIMNWLAGCGVLAATYLTLRQWRVRPALALAGMLALGAWPRFLTMWMAPDVHVPFLLWLVGFTWCFSRWLSTRRMPALCGAMFLMGCMLATRNSTILYVPFLVLGVWLSRARGESGKSLALPCACVLLPAMAALGFLWLRDRPTTLHNYITQRAESAPIPPRPKLDPPPDKLGRLAWLLRADQYWERMKTAPADILRQAWRFALEVYVLGGVLLTFAWLLGGLAMVAMWKRRAGGLAVILVGIVLCDGLFLCTYRVWDVADMSLPMVWIQLVLATLGMEQVVRRAKVDTRGARSTTRTPPRALQWLPTLCAFAAAAVCAWLTVQQIRAGPDQLTLQDEYEAVDWQALPRGATIVLSWDRYPAMSYGRVLHRPDLRVLAADSIVTASERWSATGAIYFVHPSTNIPPDWRQEREHGLWRVHTSPARDAIGH